LLLSRNAAEKGSILGENRSLSSPLRGSSGRRAENAAAAANLQRDLGSHELRQLIVGSGALT
jgi:hypothetical protein